MKKTLLLILTCVILSSTAADLAALPNKHNIVANPINLNYRFREQDPSRREAADPVIEYFKGKYYLFASKSRGYWSSPDLVKWTYIPCESITTIEGYAPTILEYKDELYFLASGPKPLIFKTKNPDLDEWVAIETKYTQGMTDPSFFKDDNGDVYIHWGCSNRKPIMGVQVDPEDGFKATGQAQVLITHNDDKYGWEVQGENNEQGKTGWNEGPCMIKYKGKYYLHYASPGTQFRTYADGIYMSDKPLGPFTYAEHSPFCFKPGGFIGGAGHGHTFQDKHGNHWHVATMKISVRQSFERRLGLFPVYFSDDDNIYSHTVLTDHPFYIPDRKVNFEKNNCFIGWNQISHGKKAEASSELPKYEASKANDERVESWWAAKTGAPGEWWRVDLGRPMDVCAIQVNFADQGFTMKYPDSYSYQYIIECSADGNSWTPLVDRSANTADMPHELVVLDRVARTRHLRITNTKEVPGNFSLSGFRVFGGAREKDPGAVSDVVVQRNQDDRRIINLVWKKDAAATGYIVHWGVDKDRMNNAKMVYSNDFEGRFFNRDSEYYFSVSSFNETGITPPEKTAMLKTAK